MLSKTAEYALRVAVCLAQSPDKLAAADELAEVVTDPQAVVIVEWADAVQHVLPAGRLTMSLLLAGHLNYCRWQGLLRGKERRNMPVRRALRYVPLSFL